jgi:hypothetical protein
LRPTAPSELENIPSGVFIAVCDIAARTTKYPLGEREMQGNLSAGSTRSRRVGRIDEHHLTASVCSFAGEMGGEQAPTGIEKAFGQVVILDHGANAEIFNRHMIVGREQPMAQLREKIAALMAFR